MENYKEDIASSRLGCLGSSDGNLLQRVAALGYVPKSEYKRLAVCKGLIEQEEIPRTAAIKAGDEMEMLIYNHLKANDPRYESNPRWESTKYAYKNVRLISHPDLVLKDDARKTLFIYEVKTTKYGIEETRRTYKSQLFIHYVIGKEMAKTYGNDWKVKVFLVHYDTDGLDLTDGELTLDVSRLTVNETRFTATMYFDIEKAMRLVDEFLDGFTEYYVGDEINADHLPEKVRTQFDDVATMLVEIKERETKVEEFKKRLYEFMVEKNIKSIKNDMFSITRVDATESKSFDGKRYLEELAKSHPRKANKIAKEFTKTTKRSGYATIKLKDNKE